MTVRLEPAAFTLVRFDADRLRVVAEEVAASLDLGDAEVEITVDERSSFGNLSLLSLDPIRCEIESGALEDPQHIRQLSTERATEAIGRVLLEAVDRRDPGFGAPPLGEKIPIRTRIAWDVSLVGRLARLGGRGRQQRRRYQFRVAHGFSDRADTAFDRLWGATSLTYTDLEAISADAAAEPAAAPDR